MVGKALPRRGSAAYSERTRSENVSLEAFVDRRSKSGEGIANAGVAEGKEGVGTAGLRRGSVGTPEGMRVVGRANGARGGRNGGVA